MTGRVPDRPGIKQAAHRIRFNQTRPSQTGLDQTKQDQARPLITYSTRPAGRSPQIFLRNPTTNQSASASMPSLQAPACWQVDWNRKYDRHRPHVAGLMIVPVCWEADWIQSIAIRSGPPSGGPSLRRTSPPLGVPYRRDIWPVKPLGLTVIGPSGPIISPPLGGLALRPD